MFAQYPRVPEYTILNLPGNPNGYVVNTQMRKVCLFCWDEINMFLLENIYFSYIHPNKTLIPSIV